MCVRTVCVAGYGCWEEVLAVMCDESCIWYLCCMLSCVCLCSAAPSLIAAAVFVLVAELIVCVCFFCFF